MSESGNLLEALSAADSTHRLAIYVVFSTASSTGGGEKGNIRMPHLGVEVRRRTVDEWRSAFVFELGSIHLGKKHTHIHPLGWKAWGLVVPSPNNPVLSCEPESTRSFGCDTGARQ